MQKSLDRKLAAIHADPSGAKDFILADAKDADMAFGIGAPGQSPEAHSGEVRLRTLAEYRQSIRDVVRQGLVDIVLMSASTNDLLNIGERLFEHSHITARRPSQRRQRRVRRSRRPLSRAAGPALPLGDASTISNADTSIVSRPERIRGANLGLYSVTFNNRLDDDLRTLEEYRTFRTESEAKGFRHFLEVFDPNAAHDLRPEQVPASSTIRLPAHWLGVAQAGRPVFLKIVYHGPRAMEELVAYDPHLVVGILGGASGNDVRRLQATIGGPEIRRPRRPLRPQDQRRECQLAFVEFLRLIVEHQITPEEAVRAYHGVLQN